MKKSLRLVPLIFCMLLLNIVKGQFTFEAPVYTQDANSSMAAWGDYLVVGEPNAIKSSVQTGKATLYKKDLVTGNWLYLQELTTPEITSGSAFGAAVAICDSFIAVGAPSKTTSEDRRGTVFIFKLSAVGSSWEILSPTLKNDGSTWFISGNPTLIYGHGLQRFGSTLEFQDNKLFIGAPNRDYYISQSFLPEKNNAGAVDVFQLQAGTWTFLNTILANQPIEDGDFGRSISADASKLVIGSPKDNTDSTNANVVTGSGSMYVYNSIGTNFIFSQKLNATTRALNAFFGSKVKLANDRLVASSKGKVYSYYFQNGKAVFKQDLPGDVVSANIGIALDENHLFITRDVYDLAANGFWKKISNVDNVDNATPGALGQNIAITDKYLFISYSNIIHGFGKCKTILDTINVSSCSEYNWNGKKYTESGNIYQYLGLDSTTNCEKIRVQNLTILNATYSTIEPQDICDYYVSPSGKVFPKEGSYLDTIPNSLGCDSIITINIGKINPSNSTVEIVSSCEPFIWSVTGIKYSKSGVYTKLIKAGSPCSDIATLILTIEKFDYIQEIETCGSYTWPVNKETYTMSGEYQAFFSTANKCDSNYTLKLKIVDFNKTITKTGNELKSNEKEASFYQWIDCSTGNLISGANSSIFNPTIPGSYAVILGKSTCTDTSECITATVTGNENYMENSVVTIFPMPVKSSLNIDFTNTAGTAKYEIFTLTGNRISSNEVEKQNFSINLSQLHSGVYFIKIEGQVYKFIKE